MVQNGMNSHAHVWLLAHAPDRAIRREQLADYFAGCLLLPAVHVRRYLTQGYGIEDLADLFGVSTRAVEVRLSQLQHTQRCGHALWSQGIAA
jgi:predicted transcriptional regulator